MLVTTSYFFGDIAIGQLNESYVKDVVQMLINSKEPDYMENILGYQLYKEFTNGISIPTPIQKWIDLRDGTEYTDTNGQIRKWQGLIKTNSLVHQSPIAYYIYYHYLRNEASINTGVGEAILQGQNGTTVSPIQKQVNAWNAMVKWNLDLFTFLNFKRSEYPYWDNLQANNTQYTPFNNLQNLYSSRKKFFQKINRYGI